eukprot:m.8844 g.8844  ORF g.8844 m.8844 type:complete len:224 (+) comp6768_c0_seq2:162-833(+)
MAAGGADPLSKRVELEFNAKERDEFDRLANMYSIVRQLDFLEKANTRGAFSINDEQDVYAKACDKLLIQYKTALTGFNPPFVLDDFIAEYEIECGLAKHRITVGTNANIEHGGASGGSKDDGNETKLAMDVAAQIVTVLDHIQLNRVSTDILHPELSNLMGLLNSFSSLPIDFPTKVKLREWLAVLNAKPADEDLGDAETRQLAHDLNVGMDSIREAFTPTQK